MDPLMDDPTVKATILAVDDIPENLTILRGLLSAEYSLKFAVNGGLALKIAREQRPDLILLDIMMPGMDGHEVCRRLKADERTADIPIIFVTAMGTEPDELKGFALGAVDYVSKPIVPAILKARVTTHLALRRARQTLREQNILLREERELIENIVDRMRNDIHFDHRYLRFITRSMEKTSGDVLFSAFRPDGGQHLLLGDFTGHGLPAAVGGPLVSNIFYHRTLDGTAAGGIIEEINDVLCRQFPTELFMAAGMVEVSPRRDGFRIWNAGLPDMLSMTRGLPPRRHGSVMPPLGILDEQPVNEGVPVAGSTATSLFLFSDGFTEAENGHGEMFGYERMEKALLELVRRGGDLDSILTEVKRFCGTGELEDDMTLLELSG